MGVFLFLSNILRNGWLFLVICIIIGVLCLFIFFINLLSLLMREFKTYFVTVPAKAVLCFWLVMWLLLAVFLNEGDDSKNDLKSKAPKNAQQFKCKHPFHMVKSSPWPFITSQTLFVFILTLVNFLHYTIYSALAAIVAFFIFLIPIFFWFRDIIRESTYMGVYTIAVQKNLRTGMVLFIISEIMFFFSLFWAFFHFSLSPSIWIGSVWPPYGIVTISHWGIPLLNTIILISSGISLTFSHKALCLGKSKMDVLLGLAITIALGLFFMMCQLYEFRHAPFSINDSVYGSIFFLITGFHGLHVIIGTIFLIVNFIRVVLNHFFIETHLGFEFSVWYWHFVDVIWIFVYLSIYWWGGN